MTKVLFFCFLFLWFLCLIIYLKVKFLIKEFDLSVYAKVFNSGKTPISKDRNKQKWLLNSNNWRELDDKKIVWWLRLNMIFTYTFYAYVPVAILIYILWM